MARKKLYIAVKCGLIEDAKHREAIGNRIWLYLHILNRCDWNTGRVVEWRDRDEAQELNVSQRTLTTQRQELDGLGYISCQQKGNHQVITVHNWTNPRSYGGDVINKGTQKCVPLEGEGTPEGTPEGTYEGSNEMSTPTYNQITDNKYHSAPSAPPQKARGNPELYAIVAALSEVCHMDLETNKSRLFKEAKLLSKGTPAPTPELLKAHYNGSRAAFWRACDWRGKLGQTPTPAAIRETWGQWNKPEEEDGLHHV